MTVLSWGVDLGRAVRKGATRLRVLICDDHVLFTDALSTMLGALGHQVVAVVHDGPDLVPAVMATQPEICLLDVLLPSGRGTLLIPAVRMASPQTRVIVLTALADTRTQVEARSLGADAVIGKHESVDVLETTFQTTMRQPLRPDRAVELAPFRRAGDTVPAARRSGAAGLTVRRVGDTGDGAARLRFLTDRERQVLAAISRGASTQQIARELGVAASTARTHIQNVLVKLGVHSRLQAAALARDADIGAAG